LLLLCEPSNSPSLHAFVCGKPVTLQKLSPAQALNIFVPNASIYNMASLEKPDAALCPAVAWPEGAPEMFTKWWMKRNQVIISLALSEKHYGYFGH
jgi:hypothetical protein